MPEKKNFVLRLDPATYKALEKWASDEFRSVNGQIEFILNQTLKEQFGKHYQEKFLSSKARPADSPHDSVPDTNRGPFPDH
ncbi:hypothetical protein [Arachidicoccus terrestris]|uniref:hypothetical protein n=1 Tax=Arachidicoccus terrestris TaxID=2875539 RepID=UPI001CC62C00|nr:hypothetical protein [Arachidicoccus terrestris]UAY54364.1 hypothetical protein K9M52_12985 [Arachidicoccus terrestris]